MIVHCAYSVTFAAPIAKLNYGATVTALGNTGSLVKTGYSFAGWNTAADGKGTAYAAAGSFAIGAANVTLYAQWTINSYTVTYDGNGSTGGTVPTDGSSPYNYGATVTALGNTGSLVKTGYSFAGWNTAADGKGTAYAAAGSFAIGAANVTLYAQWTINSYTVTYDGNGSTGGTVPTDGSSPYNYGATVTVLGNTGSLVKTGYSFAGWNTAADGKGTAYAAAGSFAIGAANVTLYAQWTINSYTVTYDGNGSTGGTVPTDGSSPYNYGATVTALGNTGSLVKTGYSFAGWNTAADGKGTAYAAAGSFAIGAANVTLYAQWTINSYTVTYDGNGSTGGTVPTDGSSPYNYGATVTVLGNTGSLVKTGYSFAGWNTAADGKGTAYAAAGSFAIGAANVTLYAQWTINSYTVTYDGNGSTGGTVPTDGSSPYNYGATVTVLGNTGSLVKTGYSFAGWNTAADGKGTAYAAAGSFAIGAANVTLYAQWTINSYTVTYDGNGSTGGTVPTDGSSPYNYGATVTALGNTGSLVKTGYSFAGWNTAADGKGTAYAAAGSFAIGAANVTLYAQWTINSYTVTYDGNGSTGGTVPTDGSSPYNYGATVTVLGNTGSLVKTGYSFAGWNTAADGKGTAYAAAGSFAIGAANVTLYAQWTINSYTVTYDGNGSTGGTVPTDGSSPYNYGATVTALGNTGSLVKTGYSFAGWNTAADGKGTAYAAAGSFAIGAANVTLYAQWTINSYTVTYDGNGSTGGTVPTDGSSPYNYGATVTVLGNTGSLVKTGYSFAGWNTAADGKGTAYAAAGSFAIGAANVTLYAQWTINSYTVTYDGNGSTGGTVPTDGSSPYNYGATVTALGNTGSLVKTGYSFAGWNTAADGKGTAYAAAGSFAIGAANVTLYAQWTINSSVHTH